MVILGISFSVSPTPSFLLKKNIILGFVSDFTGFENKRKY